MEAWGSRAFLLDAAGGFTMLREQMIREIGPEFTADILSRAGFSAAEALMAYVAQIGGASDGLAQLEQALVLLTEAGYGRLPARGRTKAAWGNHDPRRSQHRRRYFARPCRTRWLCL